MLVRFGRNLGRVAAAAVLLLATPSHSDDTILPEELVFFVQYVGTDYGVAVRDGRVVDAAEHRELMSLSGRAIERYAELRPRGPARRDLTRLRELIQARASWDAVRSLSRELVARITDELDVVPYPAETPDLENGRALYAVNCAVCHGTVGGGDGTAAAGMVPRPTTFRAPQMSLISPHQVHNAETFGVRGTAMPSYGEGLPARDLWDVAFFVMTLRDGFDPAPPVEIVPLSLSEVAARSDEELLARLRRSRPGAEARELDYYRAGYRRRKVPVSDDRELSEDGASIAEQLEKRFTQVAEKVFPSVVGISLYEKAGTAEPDRGKRKRSDGWTSGDVEERLYAGFVRVRSGTGFLVTGDGDVLTSADVVAHRGPAQRGGVIDVELAGNIHCRARVVGVEPTIDLAVLKIVPPIPLRSIALGDSDNVRAGHWAIAVGDPPGPEKTFVPGTIAARPERECYQEDRTATLLQASMEIDAAAFGGPLLNLHGEVVGLTIPASRTSFPSAEGGRRAVSALPINLAMTIYRALKVKESERSPWIGISVRELSAPVRRRLSSPPLTGIVIDDVFAASPASRAGIRVTDVLTKMDDHPILGVSDFQTWLYLLGIDARVTLELVRDGKIFRKDVTIENRPDSAVPR